MVFVNNVLVLKFSNQSIKIHAVGTLVPFQHQQKMTSIIVDLTDAGAEHGADAPLARHHCAAALPSARIKLPLIGEGSILTLDASPSYKTGLTRTYTLSPYFFKVQFFPER